MSEGYKLPERTQEVHSGAGRAAPRGEIYSNVRERTKTKPMFRE